MINIKNSKIFKLFLIVIFIAIFFVGFYLYDNAKVQTEKTELEIEQDIISELNISDWLTYENKEYGYRFKYPKELEIKTNKDTGYDLYDDSTTMVILPAKYFDIKAVDSANPKTFKNYRIGITKEWYFDQSEKTNNEIIQSFTDPPNQVKEIISKNSFTIIVFNRPDRVYVITEKDVYLIYLQGSNPEEKYVGGWLENINNDQLTEWVNNYSNYLNIFESIYSTFEIFDSNNN